MLIMNRDMMVIIKAHSAMTTVDMIVYCLQFFSLLCVQIN